MSGSLAQEALGQLTAVGPHSRDDAPTRARCLSLMGKTLRLLATQQDPVYLASLWSSETQVRVPSVPPRPVATLFTGSSRMNGWMP